MIRTLVVAPSELARAGLAAIVRGDARLGLAGEAGPAELDASVATIAPDVVLEDRDRTEATVAVPSVALVDDPRAAWRDARLERGALGPRAILARDASTEEIVGAIVAVAAGLVAVQPRALVPAAADDPGRSFSGGAAPEPLTARERDVLAELARGAANRTIAHRLAVSEHTVKFHVAAIFAKLGVSSRTEAVARGARLGLVML